MAEEIALENGRISYFQGLVTLNLTLDSVILHTVVHQCHRPLPTWQDSLKSKKSFVEERTYGHTHKRSFETHFIKWTQKSRPNLNKAALQVVQLLTME